MKITVIRPYELGEPELARWRNFQQATPALANPFLSPEFSLAAGRLRAQARVAVMSDGPQIVGFFPFERRRFGIGMPIAAGLTDCQGLVHAPGLDWDPHELLRACGLSLWEFDHLVDGQLPFEPYQALRAASPIIDLTEGFDSYLAALNRNSTDPIKKEPVRKSLRELQRKERGLARNIGEPRFVFTSRDHTALHTVLNWKSAQYLQTGVADLFARSWIVQLLEQLIETETSSCTGILSILYAGDKPVAGHFGLRSDRVMVIWFPAYDRNFAKYSPGLLLNMCMAKAAASSGIQHIDMGRGAQRYKDMLKSRDLFVAEGRVVQRSPAAALHRTRRTLERQLRCVVKEHPALFHIADRVRKHYGRIDSTLRRATSAIERGGQHSGCPHGVAEGVASATLFSSISGGGRRSHGGHFPGYRTR